MPPLPTDPQGRLRWFQSQSPIAYAQTAVRSKSPRFFGILRGVTGLVIPGVPMSNALIRRIGADTVAGAGCIRPSNYDSRLFTAGVEFSKVYNRKLLRCLIAQHHPEVERAHTEALQELRRLAAASPTTDAQKALHEETLTFLSIDDYTPRTPGCPRRLDNAGYLPLKAFPGLMKDDTERQLLRRVIDRYVTPYNRYLFTHRKR